MTITLAPWYQKGFLCLLVTNQLTKKNKYLPLFPKMGVKSHHWWRLGHLGVNSFQKAFRSKTRHSTIFLITTPQFQWWLNPECQMVIQSASLTASTRGQNKLHAIHIIGITTIPYILPVKRSRVISLNLHNLNYCAHLSVQYQHWQIHF